MIPLKAIKISVIPTNDAPRVDIDFTLRIYKWNFERYVDIERSKKVLELATFPYRTTALGRQYLADAILKAGSEMRRGRDHIVIVLTSADIYTKGMNYIFGLATLGSALISSARIDPSFWRNFVEIFHHSYMGRPFFEKQYVKVLIHELGHKITMFSSGCDVR